MREKPITQDAQLLLRLEHLRNESEMGGAINFGRKTANDYLKIDMAHGTDESRWLRQVVTYWGMAASSVLDSRLGREGFSQSQVFSRNIHSFLEGTTVARGPAQTHPNRDSMANVEKVILKSVATRKRLALESQRLAAVREKLD